VRAAPFEGAISRAADAFAHAVRASAATTVAQMRLLRRCESRGEPPTQLRVPHDGRDIPNWLMTQPRYLGENGAA
jgi:hypothetical protein